MGRGYIISDSKLITEQGEERQREPFLLPFLPRFFLSGRGSNVSRVRQRSSVANSWYVGVPTTLLKREKGFPAFLLK